MSSQTRSDGKLDFQKVVSIICSLFLSVSAVIRNYDYGLTDNNNRHKKYN